MIPALDPATGHLPPGRYLSTLAEVESRFVTHPDMAGTTTRPGVWAGLLAYLAAWSDAETLLAPHLQGRPLVRCAWLAGSFISGKLDPANSDLSVILDGEAVDLVKGRPGARTVRDLSDRAGMLASFKVSACVFRWRYVSSPFRLQSLGGTPELDYLANRGAFDDFWQRTRPPGQPKGAPDRQSADWTRGYLEVRLS